MKSLLIILTVMIWTVQDKNTVSGDGTWPGSINVSYSCSYQKGTVRENDQAVLSLDHMGGIMVDSVDVYVRSNKSSGAGVFTVTAAGETLATKSGSFKEWTGAWDNAAFHPIRLLSVWPYGLDDITVSLRGTANSLTIEKYVIYYSAAPARTVKLMNGAEEYGELQEEEGGQGVLLPEMADHLYWHFCGWSETEFWAISEPEKIYYSNTTYYPSEDCTLWAVYVYQPQDAQSYVTDLQSGDYLYVNREAAIGLAGFPIEGKMSNKPVNVSDADMIYHVDFVTSESAYITHVATGKPIGFTGIKMESKASLWSVYHSGDETTFYTTYQGKTYVLWLTAYDITEQEVYAGLIPVKLGPSPMGLLTARTDEQEIIYTCHPENELAIDEVYSQSPETIIYLGTYELHIRNGKKYLRLGAGSVPSAVGL